MMEYWVVEAYDADAMKRAVEKAMNEEGWKLHGGVSSTYIPVQGRTSTWERPIGGWVFHQGMVRGESGRKKAEEHVGGYYRL